jgi:hypothetical protein
MQVEAQKQKRRSTRTEGGGVMTERLNRLKRLRDIADHLGDQVNKSAA